MGEFTTETSGPLASVLYVPTNSALEYEQGGSTDKAKIYFEIGFAHQMLDNKADACTAFSKSSFGSFKAPSEHKMEFELKCKSTN